MVFDLKYVFLRSPRSCLTNILKKRFSDGREYMVSEVVAESLDKEAEDAFYLARRARRHRLIPF